MPLGRPAHLRLTGLYLRFRYSRTIRTSSCQEAPQQEKFADTVQRWEHVRPLRIRQVPSDIFAVRADQPRSAVFRLIS